MAAQGRSNPNPTFFILPIFLLLLLLLSTARQCVAQSIIFNVTVAADGTGNYTTIKEAVDGAPVNSVSPYTIHVKAGIYSENVTIPSDKPNIVFIGDGADKTIVTADHSNATGYGTMYTGTLSVWANGFVAKFMTFENSAQLEQGQAAALVSESDHSAFFRCVFIGYQDTLYLRRGSQFYRECNVYGTVDYICGDAAVVFQTCNLYVRQPDHPFTITAEDKDEPLTTTGFIIQNCTITASPDTKKANKTQIKGHLGRPWGVYSTVVVMESLLDDIIDPAGWSPWDVPLDNLTYREFNNTGLGANTIARVKWPSFKVLNDTSDVMPYTVSKFIQGDYWLPKTEIPYNGSLIYG